jgi:hypothetical protein
MRQVSGSEIQAFHQLSGSSQWLGHNRKATNASKNSQPNAIIIQEANATQRLTFRPHNVEPTKTQNPRWAIVHTSKNEYPVMGNNQLMRTTPGRSGTAGSPPPDAGR